MTAPLYVFPDPRTEVKAILLAAQPARWPTATISTEFPSSAISVPHVQHAWDGTPSQEQQRQNTVIRITAWTPKGKVGDGITLAQLVLAVLLAGGSANVWRFRDPVGPLVGIDPDTDLPFCTFTLAAETRPHPVA